MRIYTGTGDRGETSLFGGGRVPKSHPRVAAYGDVDELNAAIGVAAATPPDDEDSSLLEEVQRDLFAVGALLATPQREKVAKALAKASITGERVQALERAIDEASQRLPPLATFLLPGGSPRAAALHLARTVCRRAERSVVALGQLDEVAPLVMVYLNRLSDLLFTLARSANRRAGRAERSW